MVLSPLKKSLQQTLHEPSVDIYASVRLQFHSGQLFHQRVEHRAFCQLECVRVVDNSVALVVELHLGGSNHYLVYGMHLRTFHIYG